MAIPAHIKVKVEAAEGLGHTLVSQGCALFKCLLCDQKSFLDDGPGSDGFQSACVPKPRRGKTKLHAWLSAVEQKKSLERSPGDE